MRKVSLEKTYFDLLERRDKHHLMTLRTASKEREVHKEISFILDDVIFRLDEQRDALREALLE